MNPANERELGTRILAGDLRALARGATLVEAQSEAGRRLIAHIFPHTGRALLLGVTGPSGAGKSTLVDQLTKCLRREGKRVGIVAIDPSSPYSRGAILGDRIRMQDHHADPGVFIRSMATRGKLGGLAGSTLETALLLDAAGCEVVLIETVGVGQDEVDIARLADVTIVVLVPGMGDDVQAIKAGIMEVADVFAINKADLPGAQRLESEIHAMQSQAHEASCTVAVPVLRVVANEGQGVSELLAAAREAFTAKAGQGRRAEAWNARLRELLRDRLFRSISSAAIEKHAALVAERQEDPFAAVDLLLTEMEERAEQRCR